MEMSKPVLSICIPTYRRAHLLLEVLEHLDQDEFLPFPFDVLVIDNATPDDSYEPIQAFRPKNYELAFLRNPVNIGLHPNHFGAVRRARGEFVLYLADDDRLDPAALADAVLNMLADPEIVATQCCWRDLDLVSGIAAPPAIPFNAATFPPDKAGNLARSYLYSRFMPEIAIYRTSAIARCLFPVEAIFWPFALLERLFRLGKVRVADAPFYFTVSRRADEPYPRSTGGDRFTFNEWESINRGFEFLIYRYFGKQAAQVGQSMPEEVDWARSWFLDQACIQHFKRAEFIAAYELAALLAARATPCSILGGELKEKLCQLTALKAMLTTLGWMPEVTRLLLAGFDPSIEANLAATLSYLIGPDAKLTIETAAPEIESDVALLVPSEQDRRAIVKRGMVEGKAFCLEGLLEIFSY
jgi:glycosyltransferase involved in cell wall biosynthesis